MSNLSENMTSATPGNVDNKHTTDYRYDANGERICKYSDLGETIYASGYYTETDGKKISKHIYIGSTRVASQVMSRTCETSTTMKRENTLYYHTDHLGSSGYVTDKKGEFYEHTEYTSSGESWVNEKVTGNANLPYKYCLKEMDNETGLYYYGARYYDAKTSRWISTDPILESYLSGKPSGGVYDPSNLDLYSYVGNNPIKYIDPDGKRKMTAKEIATVRFFIGDGIGKNKIDYSKLKVNYTVENLKQMSYSYKSRKMVFPDVSAQKTEDDKIIAIGIIVHEVNHQFQYESDPKAWSDVIGEQIDKFFGKSDPYVYKNNYPNGITDLSQIKEKEGQCQYVEDFVENYMNAESYEKASSSASFKDSKEYYSIKAKEYKKLATEQARVLRNYGYESQAITNLLGEKKK